MSGRLSGMAVVTGASGGIGRALAGALAAEGLGLCLTGRDARKLEDAARQMAAAVRVLVHPADLTRDEEIRGLAARATAELGRLDVLVHAAGSVHLGNLETAGWEDLDEDYRVNLRAPYLLTKALLPLLKASAGQVVFINSTAGLVAGPDNGLYAATKQALRSLAGSIRDHLNGYGIRVMSVFPGRTATPMQEAVTRWEGRPYTPSELLQPSDVAQLVVEALAIPRTAEVTDLVVRPMRKPPPRGESK